MISLTGETQAGGEDAGQRFDRVLALQVACGLRAARRAILTGLATLNGKSCAPGRRLRSGDVLRWCLEAHHARIKPWLVKVVEGMAFLAKPAGLHSVALAGSTHDSLERWLPVLLPQYPEARLMQRLDFHTSGLVLAALNENSQLYFRNTERAGLCEKRYVAILSGCLQASMRANMALDCRHRRKTALMPGVPAPPIRHTEFFPLASVKGGSASLVACRIRLGSRHQIRAHACAIGHPLLGDGLYGGGAGSYRLHQGSIRLPGISCELPPDWDEEWIDKKTLGEWFENGAWLARTT